MTLEIIQFPEAVAEAQSLCLPDPDQITYYVLEKERIIYLDCDIEYDVMTVQRMIVRWNLEDKGEKAEDRRPIKMFVYVAFN